MDKIDFGWWLMKADANAGVLVGYARISTHDQSLEMQIEALQAAGVHPDNIHSDTVSGASRRRPGLSMALLDCRTGDTLIVWRLDRLGRSLSHLIQLLEGLKARGVKFRSLTEKIDTESAVGWFIIHMLGAVAQFERGLTVERTQTRIRQKMAKGYKPGPKRAMTDAQIADALKLYKSGTPAATIAKKYGVHRQVIYHRVAWPERDRLKAAAEARDVRKRRN